MQAQYGLLGEKLGHSFSPRIHRELGGYDYELVELRAEELPAFLKARAFRGVNVTIPYKQAVIPYLDLLSPRARAIGSVNTILRREDGSLLGDNTDYEGFMTMMRHAGLNPAGKKCLVLGSGGASRTVQACLRDAGAGEIRVISRAGEDHYGNLDRHRDAKILVNATPVGMYPKNGASPVDLALFPALEGVLDLIYNPARTALLLQAEALGIPCANGLRMLVAQGKAACELFLGRPLPETEVARVTAILSRSMENIVLIGMPGCGKSTVGKLLAEQSGRRFLDTDAMIEEKTGVPCGTYLREHGEEAFRRLETEAAAEAGKQSRCVIATGGGIVTRPENRDLLRQNGRLVHLDRAAAKLATGPERPLSETRALLRKRARERAPLYRLWRDYRALGDSPEQTAQRILNWQEKWR